MIIKKLIKLYKKIKHKRYIASWYKAKNGYNPSSY